MAVASSLLLPLLAKLERHTDFSEQERQAILSLPNKVRWVERGSYLLREGDGALSCNIILSGFACRHKVVAKGARQILSVQMKGDAIDLQNALVGASDHNVQALSRLQVATIPAAAIAELLTSSPGAARAVLLDVLLDGSIQREWIANVGRRDSRTRLAHLLCELGLRQEEAGIGTRDEYEMPLNQEQLADATGLTPVHVNRVLQSLRADEVIGREKRVVTIPDWGKLARIGDFSAAYLRPAAPAGAQPAG